jgi:hypothetical protein
MFLHSFSCLSHYFSFNFYQHVPNKTTSLEANESAYTVKSILFTAITPA